jgi:hypothetical protein
MNYDEERAALDKDIALYRAMRARLDRVWEGLSERNTALIDSRLAEITDEQILTDAETRAWVCSVRDGNSEAHKRIKPLVRLDVDGVLNDMGGDQDGRDEYYAQHLPTLTVGLERDTDVAALAAGLRIWVETWGMGRHSLIFKVMESTLSRWGSYSIEYIPGAEPAEARLLRNGRPQFGPAVEGSLETVLGYVSIYHVYNHGRDLPDEDGGY